MKIIYHRQQNGARWQARVKRN